MTLASLELTYRTPQSLPVELEGFTPDAVRGESLDAIKRRSAFVGNTTVVLGELFDIAGDARDLEWRLMGDLSGVHWLGAGMRAGAIRVEGSIGRHTGSQMRGGQISVSGAAGDWLGAEMRGGRIEVRGDAGHSVGAAYPGSPRGMRGGSLVVRGSAGDEIGHTMRRGWITVGGDCGELVGYRMKAGTIFVFGQAGQRPGAEMIRGTIGLFGAELATLLPTFRRACRFAPQFMGLLQSELTKLGYDLPGEIDLYHGDLLNGGRGEILLPG